MEYNKFERARILGARALQVSMGAPVLVSTEGETNAIDIAVKEIRANKVPITVQRPMPPKKEEA